SHPGGCGGGAPAHPGVWTDQTRRGEGRAPSESVAGGRRRAGSTGGPLSRNRTRSAWDRAPVLLKTCFRCVRIVLWVTPRSSAISVIDLPPSESNATSVSAAVRPYTRCRSSRHVCAWLSGSLRGARPGGRERLGHPCI